MDEVVNMAERKIMIVEAAEGLLGITVDDIVEILKGENIQHTLPATKMSEGYWAGSREHITNVATFDCGGSSVKDVLIFDFKKFGSEAFEQRVEVITDN